MEFTGIKVREDEECIYVTIRCRVGDFSTFKNIIEELDQKCECQNYQCNCSCPCICACKICDFEIEIIP